MVALPFCEGNRTFGFALHPGTMRCPWTVAVSLLAAQPLSIRPWIEAIDVVALPAKYYVLLSALVSPPHQVRRIQSPQPLLHKHALNKGL